jgi:NAD dependent epimerase/dehydratase family enzyme
VVGEVLHRPSALPAPAVAIKLALGEGSTIVLEGQRVLPARAQREGYRFRFDDLRQAVTALLA